jgi:hypothetical protein
MSHETQSLQQDMFTGELVDTRSDAQRRKDHAQAAPQQIAMFTVRETVDIGLAARSSLTDWLVQATAPPLRLELLDIRTPEEQERDRIRDEEKLTIPLFDRPLPNNPAPSEMPSLILLSLTVERIAGLKARLRRVRARIRQRSAA